MPKTDTTHFIKDAGIRLGRQVGRYAKERPAITASFVLHLVLILLLTVGMPLVWKKETPPPPRTVSVELLPIREKTNVKPQEKAPEVKKEPDKKEPPKPKPAPTKPKEEPKPTPKPVAKPKPKPATPKPVEKPKEKPKPKEEPKKKPEEKKVDDFDALLNNLEEQKQKIKKQEKQEAEYDPSQELSISERDFIVGLIKQQFEKRWEIPAGSRDAATTQVKVTFKVKPDGTVYDVQIVDSLRYKADATFRSAADAARRAAYNASPLKDLPPKQYDHWKENTFTFDPKDMF